MNKTRWQHTKGQYVTTNAAQGIKTIMHNQQQSTNFDFKNRLLQEFSKNIDMKFYMQYHGILEVENYFYCILPPPIKQHKISKNGETSFNKIRNSITCNNEPKVSHHCRIALNNHERDILLQIFTSQGFPNMTKYVKSKLSKNVN